MLLTIDGCNDQRVCVRACVKVLFYFESSDPQNRAAVRESVHFFLYLACRR